MWQRSWLATSCTTRARVSQRFGSVHTLWEAQFEVPIWEPCGLGCALDRARMTRTLGSSHFAQGHFADASGPVCSCFGCVLRHVIKWEGIANGFSKTPSRTPCGRPFCEGLVHPRFVGRRSTISQPLQIPRSNFEGHCHVASRSQHAEGCASKHRDQCPPELQAAAHAKIERLQATISALGNADKAEKESLVKSPHRVQAQVVLPPVSEQIASTQGSSSGRGRDQLPRRRQFSLL